MKIYKPRGLIPAYKLGKEGRDYYVAVPSKYKDVGVVIKFKDEEMVINWEDEIEKRAFRDKFTGEDYHLSYFKWQPTGKQNYLIGGSFNKK